MKVWSLAGLQSVTTWQDLRRFVTQGLTNISQILNQRVGFSDNIHCEIVNPTIETTETAIPHNLGVVPIGFIVLNATDTQYPRGGTTPWTTTTIYLIANTRTAYRIAIIGS